LKFDMIQLSFLEPDDPQNAGEAKDQRLETIISRMRQVPSSWGDRNREENYGLRAQKIQNWFSQTSHVAEAVFERSELGYEALGHMMHGVKNMHVQVGGFMGVLPKEMYELMNPAEILALFYGIGKIKEDENLMVEYREHMSDFPTLVSKLVSSAMGGPHGSFYRPINARGNSVGLATPFTAHRGWLQDRMYYLEHSASLGEKESGRNPAREFLQGLGSPYIPSTLELYNVDNIRQAHWDPEAFYDDPNALSIVEEKKTRTRAGQRIAVSRPQYSFRNYASAIAFAGVNDFAMRYRSVLPNS
jgi:hypothetical protein